MKLLIFLLFVNSISFFSQEVINVSFDKKTQHSILTGEDRVVVFNTIQANVKTKFGNFNVEIIDFNKNNTYLDTLTNSNNNNDILCISQHKNPISSKIYGDGDLLIQNGFRKNNTFIINGHPFKIYNFRLRGEKLTVKVQFTNQSLKEISSELPQIVIDRLPSENVLYLKNDKTINTKDLLEKGKYLYIESVAEWCSPCFTEINKIQNLDLPNNIKFCAIAIQSDKEVIKKLFDRNKVNTWETLFIEKEDEEKPLKFIIRKSKNAKICPYGTKFFIHF